MTIKRINLIPPSDRAQFSLPIEPLVAILVIAALCWQAVDYMKLAQSTSKQIALQANVAKDLTVAKSALATLGFENIEDLKKASDVESPTTTLKTRVVWSDLYKELTALIPENAWLVSLVGTSNEEGRRVLLTGMAPSQTKVSDFFGRLEGSFHFRNVNMVSALRQKDVEPELYSFEFEVQLPGGPARGAETGGKENSAKRRARKLAAQMQEGSK